MNTLCDYCSMSYCSYEPHSKECQTARDICEFCENHSKGCKIFEHSHSDGTIIFDLIEDIKYCPLCGRELDD